MGANSRSRTGGEAAGGGRADDRQASPLSPSRRAGGGSSGNRQSLSIALVRLRSVSIVVSAAVFLIAATEQVALDILTGFLLQTDYVSTNGASAVANVGHMFFYLAAVPAALLLDGFVLPRIGLLGSLLIASVFATALATVSFPSASSSPRSTSRAFYAAVASICAIFLGLSAGFALYTLCAVLANVREKALRIKRTLEHELLLPKNRTPPGEATTLVMDTTARSAARSGAAWRTSDAHRHNDDAALGRSSSSGSARSSTARSIADAVYEYSLVERATWFSHGPMSLYVFVILVARLLSGLLSYVSQKVLTDFNLVCIVTVFVVTALLLGASVHRALPQTLSAIPTIDELVVYSHATAAATATKAQRARSGSKAKRGHSHRSLGAGSSDDGGGIDARPSHVNVVYSGVAAFEVLWRRFVGESRDNLIAVYGSQPVVDAEAFARVLRYMLPTLLVELSCSAAQAATLGILFNMHSTGGRYETASILAAFAGGGGLLAALVAYAWFSLAARASSSRASTESQRVLPLGPRAFALTGSVISVVGVAIGLLIFRSIQNDLLEYGAWTIAALPVMVGMGYIMVFAALLSLVWSSTAPSLRVYSLAALWVTAGLGQIAASWKDASGLSADDLWAYLWVALGTGVAGALLYVILIVLDRGKIIDEGALIGRTIAPDVGEDAFVLEARLAGLRGGVGRRPTQPGSLLRRARHGGDTGGYGSMEMA